ncbi:hypothetical protein PFICI_04001 [Pestalotiopsis fici W106-1]|uniref:F-box domain-containing protein n=1 Tax=Pestalotiopsis fici (strain W106-1 / CGMCC3.15140) TaxID=1229662 RepID=W3XL41_PESFW|nr:uncharacterized protein PFICI_04001 [Pestalotiopsis fici W106-1]ETS85976.1 hypothetical protein PFICI_04001 [Pestalotiopsis fici W106-1]
MAPSLDTLPVDLFREIISLLSPPAQASLSRTCTAYNRCLLPFLWSEIECHHLGTHEGIDVESEVSEYKYTGKLKSHKSRFNPRVHRREDVVYPYEELMYEPSRRRYCQEKFDPVTWSKEKRFDQWNNSEVVSPPTRLSENCNRRNFQFGREEQFISVRKISSPDRWVELARHVRSLCMSIGVDDEVIRVIGSLPNLTSLELVGLPLNNGHPALAPSIDLPVLKNLKLRGYLPSAFVRNVCSNAQNIKYLNIGVLATPKDDEAYRRTLLLDDGNSEIITEEEAASFQRKGIEAIELVAGDGSIAENGDGDADAKEEEGDEDADDSDDDQEEDDDEPFALHGAIWLPKALPSQFATVTHLHLVKPYTGETSLGDLGNDAFTDIPHRYEQVLCHEWVFLLRGVAPTLKELVLEHRVPQHWGDTVGDGDPHPRTKGSNRGGPHNPFIGTDPDRGDVLFCRSVLRLLLEQSSRFENLRRLALRGIQINGIPTQRNSTAVPGIDGAPNNDKLLEKAFPACDLELFHRVFPLLVYDGSTFEGWEENRHEAMQDEGDGLMYNLQYFNDYKKRFGPQWRKMD